MSIETHLGKINPPLASFSRAGRMAESLGGKKTVKTLAKAPPPPRDYLKLLTAGDLGGEEREGAVSQSNDAEAYERGDELCSSAREHPVTVKRQTFVSAVEKELAFKSALKQFHPRETTEIPVPRLVPMETLARTASSMGSGGGTSPTSKGKEQAAAVVAHSGALNATSSNQTGAVHDKKPVPEEKVVAFGGTSKRATTKEYKVSDSTPPVGHYHPKFGVLDLHEQTAFISKPRVHSSRRGASRGRPGTEKSGGARQTTAATYFDQSTVGTIVLDASLGQTMALSGQTQIPAGSASVPIPPGGVAANQQSDPGKAQQVKIGTSAFLSGVPKGGMVSRQQLERSQSVPLTQARVNEGHFGPPQNRSNVRFDRQLGRSERERLMTQNAAGANDLAYYPKMASFHSPALSFSVQVPRERDSNKLPRTSHNVPTAQRMLPADYDLDKTKFNRLTCSTNFQKQVSRQADTNNMIVVKRNQSAAWDDPNDLSVPSSYYPSGIDTSSGQSLPMTSSASRHTPTFKMGRVPGRKPVKPKEAHDVIYEVDYGATDKQLPTPLITGTPNRPKIGYQGIETIQIGVGKYDVDSKLVYRTTAKNVEIGRVISRDKREHIATGHIDTLSNAVYDADTSIKKTQEKRVPGNPFMNTHVSRNKRMQVMATGEVAPLDKTYDWSPDSGYLRRGAVEFGKQVERENHAGSNFSNAMKRELSPLPHD